MKVQNLMGRLDILAEDVGEAFAGDGTVNVEAFRAGVEALKAQLRPALPPPRPPARPPQVAKPKRKGNGLAKPRGMIGTAAPRIVEALEKAGETDLGV